MQSFLNWGRQRVGRQLKELEWFSHLTPFQDVVGRQKKQEVGCEEGIPWKRISKTICTCLTQTQKEQSSKTKTQSLSPFFPSFSSSSCVQVHWNQMQELICGSRTFQFSRENVHKQFSLIMKGIMELYRASGTCKRKLEQKWYFIQ